MRKLTRERAGAVRLADGFSGLPPGTSHLHLWDWINDARSPLGLSSDEISLLGYYFKRSRAEDWLMGREPVVAWPRFEVCFDLDWTEDKLARVENALCNKQLIAFRDRPDCKRRMFRDPDGRIAHDATGISLAPAGSRTPEIRALAFQHREDRSILRRLFGDLFKLRAALRAAEGHPYLSEPVVAAVRDLLGDLPLRRDPGASLTLLSALLERGRAVLAHLKTLIGLPDRAAEEAERAMEGARPLQGTVVDAWVPLEPQNLPVDRVSRSRSLHRTDAAQKDPDSINQRDDQKIIEELRDAPDMFRVVLEIVQEKGRGLPWIVLLGEALENYGNNLGLQGRHIGRMTDQFGFAQTLAALFRLGRMIEKGTSIRNPAGYAVTIVRQRGRRGGGGAIRTQPPPLHPCSRFAS